MHDEVEAKSAMFEGTSKGIIRGFPKPARQRAGHELHQIALGEERSDWKSMPLLGSGGCEIRIKTAVGGQRLEHRVIYVAKFDEAVYVLHAFQKTTRKTSQRDIDIAKKRYSALKQKRNQGT